MESASSKPSEGGIGLVKPPFVLGDGVMSMSGDSKSDRKPEIVAGSVELIVTPELREKIALKRLKRQNI